MPTDFTSVLIAIQARSTSKRFPRKVFELIGGKPLLNHVIDSCDRAAKYMNNHMHSTRIMVKVALLIPFGDDIGPAFRGRAMIHEGPEHDVLARYASAVERFDADYIVRVTGDCPLIPSYLITKHIKTAKIGGYSYVSNVDEEARTAADGTDCEVISRDLMAWLSENAKDPKDREHVTTLARRSPPEWAKIAHVIGHLDLSSLKLSVDTPEDLERVREAYERVKTAQANAERLHGKASVHRF